MSNPVGTGLTTSASGDAETKPEGDGVDPSRSDAAQQPSASLWVTWCEEPAEAESDWCIGHVAPAVQQAIRAAGVASHPSHSPPVPASSARSRETADRRRPGSSTFQECVSEVRGVKCPRGLGGFSY
jgi:hypothetical protein